MLPSSLDDARDDPEGNRMVVVSAAEERMSADLLARIEAKLETLATKEDLKAFPTKEDLKDELKDFVRKGDLTSALAPIERRLDKLEVNQEQMRDEIKLIAEGHAATQELVLREGEKTRKYIDDRVAPLEDAVRLYFRSH